ncbi:LIC11966 family surface protein [Leptospira stimsonii]|uniref:LIC11966 family surface protein n=1 Tax=Leptospira stimsonii TaxID=2202203 RepID=UPI00157F9EF7|nr:hypothetical protein [Leptospira stimsonii]
MKNTKYIILFATVCCILLFSACNTQNPVDYNNKIIDTVNKAGEDLDAMNEAMSKEDFTSAESIRKQWEAKLVKALEELKTTKDFKGKSDLKNAGIASIELYQKIVGSDYKSLIELRLSLKSGAKVNETQIDALLENIVRNLEKATNDLKAASDRFEQEFTKPKQNHSLKYKNTFLLQDRITSTRSKETTLFIPISVFRSLFL